MSAAVDLTLKAERRGEALLAFVVTPNGHDTTVVPWPAAALEWQQEWQRQFLAHHEPATAPVRVDAVRRFGDDLIAALRAWLNLPECGLLRQALATYLEAPLRLRLEGAAAADLERLPWQVIAGSRPFWRLEPATAETLTGLHRVRRPRLLLVVGDETGLRLDDEVERLEALQSRGRLELQVLRGGSCGLAALRQALLDRGGWDGLVFLGHSEADPNGGGRLHLGDGSWVGAAAFENQLQTAARAGLALALFNSCSGLDLARSSVRAGLSWALCFRAPVPCSVASRAFAAVIRALEAGADLLEAVRQARSALEVDAAAVGGELLLSLVAHPAAADYRLPLRKRKQLLLRLQHSSRGQAMAAAGVVMLALVADVHPANPISTYLLDRRLYLQRLWREATGQPSPQRAALPVLVIHQGTAGEAGATETPGRVSRDLLAKLLQRVAPKAVPKVGLDLALDEPAPFTQALADVISSQQRPHLYAGYFGGTVQARRAGPVSQPLPVLLQAGLQARDLATGTPALAGAIKWVPLQIWQPLSDDSFAGALASAADPQLPVDAVIDWSIDWRPLIRRVELGELADVQADALLIGSDGQLDRDGDDLFEAPGAMDPALSQTWQGAERRLPGVLLQAVLAQSMSLGHWLTPASQAMTTALAAGLGVLLAAAQSQRRRRVLLTVVVGLVALPLCWQLAIANRWLVPLALPLLAFSATAMVRRD